MALELWLGGEPYRIEIVHRRPRLILRIDGRLHEVVGHGPPEPGHGELTIDGTEVAFARAHAGGERLVRLDGRSHAVTVLDPRTAAETDATGQDDIRAPMPGAVVTVHKTAGETVARGETVLTIESMKLQTALVAPRDGELETVLKTEGDYFEKDEVVARLAARAEEG